ncbi:VOC family protein [Staphylococcus sp. 17KM0847]|uniref:VOC family protein n=1 Tax=Staphylococcus sp. 17KM0847 TaxID=2583989 RepID=UPI0015DC4E3D|nr:VOC family protein [Staphylococcus sp. 17KM0847]QLK86680.1 ring-cleaving dioxygenase [Staphylococcus sp. 17KM0847]
MTYIMGHHHVSMYTKDKIANKHFYQEVLGLKLVKETVNQDNHDMVHLFYGDAQGTVGTLLTFFELPHAGQMRKGTDMIARVGLLVDDEGTLDDFAERLRQYDIPTTYGTYRGQPTLQFDDPDHLSLMMVANNQASLPLEMCQSTNIASEHRILGLGPIEIHVRDKTTTIEYLTCVLGYNIEKKGNPTILTLDAVGYYTDIVVVEKSGDVVRPGRGFVHHHALAVKNHTDLQQIMTIHDTLPGNHSGIIDRKWFESLYYRQNGIMYEFATSEPYAVFKA